MPLDDRKKIILRAVVNDYIETAEPVASKVLSSKLSLKLSPATLRNEMAELENMGYLQQPHTSSGRMPSHKGYRLYVDELMNVTRLSAAEMDVINKQLGVRLREVDRLVTELGRLVSELTNYATYSSTQQGTEVRVRQVELLALDVESCVVVVIFSESNVKNTVVRKPADMDRTRLFGIAELITASLYDKTRNEITTQVIIKISAASGAPMEFVGDIVDFVRGCAEELDKRKIYVEGASHILAQPEFQDAFKARSLIEYLSEGDHAALPAPGEDGGVRILIGPENISEELKDSSVVVSSYEIGGGMRGYIGVVGPMRMDYSGVASRLGYLTGRLTDKFTGSMNAINNSNKTKEQGINVEEKER